MPRLLVFLPADKLLIDFEDSGVGVFGIITKVLVGIREDETLQPDATAPLRWYVLTIWKRESTDEESRYEQRLRLETPSGRLVTEFALDFNFGPDDVHKNKVTINGFPVSELGEYILKLSLRPKSGDGTWQEISEYPLSVVRAVPLLPSGDQPDEALVRPMES